VTEAVALHLTCFRCGRPFREGEPVVLVDYPVFFRYGKQRKRWERLKGDKDIRLLAHEWCRERATWPVT
jgi:hypothetical protein